MSSLKGIESFIAVAKAGSFARAAGALAVSPVAVGKNVATLERQLGVRLFERTTRRLRLTPAGGDFLAQCEAPWLALQAAQARASTAVQSLSGSVRMTCVTPVGMRFVLPALGAFQTRYPDTTVELQLSDAVVDLVAERYDLGLRVGAATQGSFVARRVAALSFVVCATPAYLDARGTPRGLADLSRHACLRLRREHAAAPSPWFLRGFTEQTVARGGVVVGDFMALVGAALQNLGLACAPLPLVMPLLRAGQLRPVLAHLVEPRADLFLHYPSREHLPQRTRVLVDFLLERLRAEPDLQTPVNELLSAYA